MVPPAIFGGVSATISIGLARGDGAVFCFAPGVLEGAAAGNVLGQDRFVKKHGGDFQRWLRLGGSSISSMVVRRRMVPSRLVVSVCRLTSRRLEVGRVAADQIMPRKAPTPCIRVGLVRLVLISVRPPNGQLARGSKVQSIHRSQHARCLFTGTQTFKCQSVTLPSAVVPCSSMPNLSLR